jgi:hypothetical protein
MISRDSFLLIHQFEKKGYSFWNLCVLIYQLRSLLKTDPLSFSFLAMAEYGQISLLLQLIHETEHRTFNF